MRDILDKLSQLEQPVQEQSVFEIGDAFGISLSEDHEIGTEIVGFVEDGIVVDLDETALEMLASQGVIFLEGELTEGLRDPKDNPCWKGYKPVGTKKKNGKTVPNCVPKESIGEDHGPEDPDADYNQGEYDREGDMAKDQLRTIDSAAEELYAIINANENLPEWVQKKITLAMDYIDTARDYLKSNKYAEGMQNEDEGEGKYKGIDDKNGTRFADWMMYHGNGLADNWHTESEGYDLIKIADDFEKRKIDFKQAQDRIFDLFKQGHDVRASFIKNFAPNKLKNPPDEWNSSWFEGMETEAKYQGKEVPLGKKLPGDVKKSKVYVRKPNGKVVKVNFGDKKMRIKKSNPARRKSFRARHNCKNPGPRWKARYWSCRSW